MGFFPYAFLVLSFLLVTADQGGATKRHRAPANAAGVASTRAQIAASCDCAGARNHGAFVSCASEVVQEAVRAGTLSADDSDKVMNCAAQSVCGKPGVVMCRITEPDGETTCS